MAPSDDEGGDLISTGDGFLAVEEGDVAKENDWGFLAQQESLLETPNKHVLTSEDAAPIGTEISDDDQDVPLPVPRPMTVRGLKITRPQLHVYAHRLLSSP